MVRLERTVFLYFTGIIYNTGILVYNTGMLVRLKRTICLYFTGIIYNTGMLVRWCTPVLRTQITTQII